MQGAPSAAMNVKGGAEERWLVVDQLEAETSDFSAMLKEIDQSFGLDPYTARQRLIGRGYSLLRRGSLASLSPLRELLAAHTITACLLEPVSVSTPPARLQGLRPSDAALGLLTDDGELTIDSNVHVVAVLADLSGAAIANGVKQLMVRRAYQGDAAVRRHDEERFCRAIIKGKPVLDLYLLPVTGGAKAVRVLPGRYDPDGLGPEKTLSAGLNLLKLIDLARNRAGHLTLRTDFGESSLPGCQLAPLSDDAGLDRNLAALSRFGTLAARFAGCEGAEKRRGEDVSSNREDAVPEESDPGASMILPAPPETEGRTTTRGRLWLWGDTAGIALVLVVLAVAGIGRHSPLFHWFWENGVGRGAVPALLALILFWRGFSAVRLKRLLENTPVSRIRSLAAGMVEVSGRAERCYALVTPVTQTPCIYYCLSRYQRRERNGSWQLVARHTSGLHPFWLRDATGKVLIDPAAADLRPGCRQEGSGAGLNSSFMNREFSPDSDEKWVEESIPEGETVYVLGFSAPRRRANDSLHEATAAALRRLKGSGELHKRFDQNGDGRIDAEEWDEARRTVAAEVAALHLSDRQERRRQEESLVVGMPPRRSLPFLVAQTHCERSLVRALWWRALLFFLLALLLILWTIRQLLIYRPVLG